MKEGNVLRGVFGSTCFSFPINTIQLVNHDLKTYKGMFKQAQ